MLQNNSNMSPGHQELEKILLRNNLNMYRTYTCLKFPTTTLDFNILRLCVLRKYPSGPHLVRRHLGRDLTASIRRQSPEA